MKLSDYVRLKIFKKYINLKMYRLIKISSNNFISCLFV